MDVGSPFRENKRTLTKASRGAKTREGKMKTVETIGIGNMPVSVVEKLLGRSIGRGVLLGVLQTLANKSGAERRLGVIDVFKKLAFQNCSCPTEGQPATESMFAGDMALATLDSAESFQDALAFLDDVANLPPNSLTTNPMINWNKQPQHQVVDYTATLQVTVGLAAMDWYTDDVEIPENYLNYVKAIQKLFTCGREASLGLYAKFAWKAKGDPMEEISQRLARIDWGKSSGQTILNVLHGLATTKVLSFTNKTDRFIDLFAKEVAHKQVSYISPNMVTKLFAPLFFSLQTAFEK